MEFGGPQGYKFLRSSAIALWRKAYQPISLLVYPLNGPKQSFRSVKFKECLVFGLAAGAVPALAEFTKNFLVVCGAVLSNFLKMAKTLLMLH